MATSTPVPLRIVRGDLLDAPGFLVHQVNAAATTKPKGLSASMFAKFPQANVYDPTVYHGVREPGKVIVIRGDTLGHFIVNIVGQRGVGKPKAGDTATDRLGWFRLALTKLQAWLQANATAPGFPSQVSFPYGIGCGLAGGNWSAYLAEIEHFATGCPIPVVIYQL